MIVATGAPEDECICVRVLHGICFSYCTTVRMRASEAGAAGRKQFNVCTERYRDL